MTLLVLCATTARTRIIPPWLFALHKRGLASRPFEVYRPRGLSHSCDIFVDVSVFDRSLCRYVNRERLRPVVGSIGTNLCDDGDEVRSLDGQRSCACLVIHPGPVNLVVVLLKPNEERLTVPEQNKVASGMLVQGLAEVRQHLGQITPAFFSKITDMALRRKPPACSGGIERPE